MSLWLLARWLTCPQQQVDGTVSDPFEETETKTETAPEKVSCFERIQVFCILMGLAANSL